MKKMVSQNRQEGGASGNQYPQNLNSLGNPLDRRTKLYTVCVENLYKSPQETLPRLRYQINIQLSR